MSWMAPTPEGRASSIDLVELSDLAWSVIDPEGEREQLEQAWTAALPHDWPPPADLQGLRERLTESVQALRSTGPVPLLEVACALILYLAAHPERRRIEQALVGDALRAEYGANVPSEIAEWLARRPSPTAHARPHGAPARRRHFHARPPREPEEG